MRIAIFGLVAATAALCTGCTPAVGSPEWCKQMQANPPKDMASVTQEQAQGMAKCVVQGMQDALGKMGTGQ